MPSLKAWSKAVTRSGVEFGSVALPVLSGSLPPELQGSLYRNGPGLLARGKTQVGHWFDGDGAILGVHFRAEGATGLYRYVKTSGYLTESEAGQFLFAGYGMVPPGPFWQRFTRGVKNVANTSVLALPDRLLALWEGGHPHALDLETLETQGLTDLTGLQPTQNYSAHPKQDPDTGEIFNFCVSLGANAVLWIYRSDRFGKILQQSSIQLQGFPVIHDFVLAGRYLVFCIPPVRLNFLPIVARLKSYSESLDWKPELGTQILVLDRETFEVVSQVEAEPWYQWHLGNGFVESDGILSVDVVRYQDFQTNQYLREVATGQTHTSAPSQLWQLRLDPQAGQLLSFSPLLDRICEFPVVPPNTVGKPTRSTYLSVHRSDHLAAEQELFGAIARYDHRTQRLTIADCGENCYPVEPIYAPHPQQPDRGWIITVVYDGNRDTSEVWIYDSERLNAEPICRLGLPEVVPIGFHGTWRSV